MFRSHEDQRTGRAVRFALLIGITGIVVGGCATTNLVNLWKDPQYSQPPMTRMLVVVMKSDPARRRIWEDALAEGLSKRGVKADPSYRLFPNAAPDTDEVIDAVHAHDYDGVLVTHRLRPELESHYVPGYVTDVPVTRFDRWSGAYHTYFVDEYHPGYTETDKVVRNQIEVWSTAGGWRLVWTGVTDSLDPSSSRSLIHEVSHAIVPEIARQGIIAAK